MLVLGNGHVHEKQANEKELESVFQ